MTGRGNRVDQPEAAAELNESANRSGVIDLYQILRVANRVLVQDQADVGTRIGKGAVDERIGPQVPRMNPAPPRQEVIQWGN